MIVFADTNWLEALYFEPNPNDPASLTRAQIVVRRSRLAKAGLTISPIVLLEARNVFSRLSGMSNPKEWGYLLDDFHGKIFVDPMNWDLLRQEAMELMEKFSHRIGLGSSDFTIVASAKLSGASEILSFDEKLKVLAAACGLEVFPPLKEEGRRLLAKLKTA